MSFDSKIFKLKGKVQHYAWGGFSYIPELLGFVNEDHLPCAEYWMGAHPSASSEIITEKEEISLYQLVQSSPERFINKKVYKEFGELPYLFKILDVNDMLSIQVHPTREEAEKGFDREEAEGVLINAPERNYKDRNHKPEVMVALSEFWLLHGFRQPDQLERVLEDVPEFNILIPLFKKKDYKALYQFVMEMGQLAIDAMLLNLVKNEIRKKNAGELTKADPGWWVSKLFEGKTEIKNIDRGIFSIYFFNIVRAEPGEAVFQGAGIPHAYLEGQNVELMANSDNVLRGGLTPKHIDVPELLKHTLFEGVKPNVMKGNPLGLYEKNYPCPVRDFGINRVELSSNDKYGSVSASLEIIIAIEGGCIINSGEENILLKKGESVTLLPETEYKIVSSGHCLLFKAFVPS